jgi:hypothetical protein
MRHDRNGLGLDEPAGELPPPLRRPFRIIAFDWDGTAVISRHENTTPLRASVDLLLRLGVVIMVVSGTKLANIDLWRSSARPGAHRRDLFISTNRGSEMYGFDARCRPVLLWRRAPSRDEDRLLTEVIDAVRNAVVARTGLPVRTVYDRVNRRKLDLAVLAEWRDPPRSAIGEVWRAVEARLRGAGLGGGLREVLALAARVAQEKGLQRACLTADAKQVEVGLTDKSDAIDWLMRELAWRRRIPSRDLLVVGDEFGPIAGLAAKGRGKAADQRFQSFYAAGGGAHHDDIMSGH